MKFNKLKGSLRGKDAPSPSILRDTLIGDVYIQLVKNGNTYSVIKRQAPSAVDPKFKKSKKSLFSGNEEDAEAKFDEIVLKYIQEM